MPLLPRGLDIGERLGSARPWWCECPDGIGVLRVRVARRHPHEVVGAPKNSRRKVLPERPEGDPESTLTNGVGHFDVGGLHYLAPVIHQHQLAVLAEAHCPVVPPVAYRPVS